MKDYNMHKSIISYLLLFIVGLSTPVFSQLDPNKLTHYSEMDGNIIYDVISDRMGNIWMATQSGLVKFDGYEYTRFNPDANDTTTIGSILTHRLYEGSNGKIFITCLDFIEVYDPVTRSFENHPFIELTDFPPFAQTGIRDVASDGRGRIYFGATSAIGVTASHGLVYFDENEEKMKRFEYPDTLEIMNTYQITTDPIGNVWFLSYSGLFKIDPNNRLYRIIEWDQLNLNEDEFFYHIRSDNTGMIWFVTTNKKLVAYDPYTENTESWSIENVFKDKLERFSVHDLIIDTTNNLWIATEKGLIYFNRENEMFETFGENHGKSETYEAINSLHFDSFGNLWMGTRSSGLLKYNTRALLGSYVYKVNDNNSLSAGWVNKVFESDDGSIWIATAHDHPSSGFSRLDPVTGTLTSYSYSSLKLGIRWFNVFGELEQGEIIAETSDGLLVFDTRDITVRKTSLEGLEDSVSFNDLYTDSRGNMWYSTYNGLFHKKKGSNKINHYDISQFQGDSISSNEIAEVRESEKYGLWLLTNNGLYLYNYDTDQITRHAYDPRKGEVLPSQDVNSFYEGSDGIVWVGTWQGGLCRYDPRTGKIRTYTNADGLASMSIQGILADEENNDLWISTFAGISRFSIEEEQFNNFSLEDGIQGLLYADGSYLKTTGGLFIFGGSNGITIFDPDDIDENSIPPRIYITDFKIANQSMGKGTHSIINDKISQPDGIELKHDQNNISFDYVGLQYDNATKNRYSYILENYDDSWREVVNQRTAYYYNLPPGKYTFRVNASNSNGVWNETGIFMNIRINPPWWKTWWAYALYGLFVIAAIILFDRFQRRRLVEKAKNQARERELEQAKEIEKAYHKLKTTQSQLLHAEKMASLGELTAGIAHEIQNPLNFINNFSEVNSELLIEMKDELENKNLAEVKAIADDLAVNEEKIYYHGKRADSIVKGMLQHSRSSNGEKVFTDINAIADEYLRMAYHGLRAKDQSFNADFKTEFDEELVKIKVIPQDIGRVLLNLINNAFYAVARKGKEDPDGYEPRVVISTKQIDDMVEIRVIDNGGGIPENIREKIFQPFFTTKAAGQGTGLGLSLSYDIITKGHGGSLKVVTKESEGTEFIIILPQK